MGTLLFLLGAALATLVALYLERRRTIPLHRALADLNPALLAEDPDLLPGFPVAHPLSPIVASLRQVLLRHGNQVATLTQELETEQRRTRGLRRVLALAQDLALRRDPDHLTPLIQTAVHDLCRPVIATIWLIDPATEGVITTVEGLAPSDEVLRALQTVQPLNIHNSDGSLAGLVLPIRHRLQPQAILEVRTGSPLVATTVEALEFLAAAAGTGLAAARLHRESDQRTELDGLTRLLNRRKFDSDLRREVHFAGRHDRPLCVI